MSADLQPPPFAFCIDTNAYAGNFVREMCAYITGVIGECGVGEDLAGFAHKELSEEAMAFFDDAVLAVADEHGCHRPASIFPTPGFFNDGHGACYPDEDLEKRHDEIVARAKERITKDAERYKDGPNHWIYVERAADAEKFTLNKFPAYQSVCIFFGEEPPDEIIILMEERAQKYIEQVAAGTFGDFTSRKSSGLKKVLGFRLIQFELQTTELYSTHEPED